jgi:hypothetical protein
VADLIGNPALVATHAPAVLRAAGLSGREVADVTRATGGSKKGVYRLRCADGFSAILYVWSDTEDYWPPSAEDDPAGVFVHATGSRLFEACASSLLAAGVRIPHVYLIDRSHSVYPADIALVEDVNGGTIDTLLESDPGSADPEMERLGAMLKPMWQDRHARIGKVGGGSAPDGLTCEQIVLSRAVSHLAGAADRVPRIAAVRTRLGELLRMLADGIEPRTYWTLIHGELAPEHVLRTAAREPVVIDIEGLMYFDVEWEHVFLRLTYGKAYRWLRVDGLDERRMRLYALAMDLSLVEGPLRLLDGGYPDRDIMLEIAGNATGRVLATAEAKPEAAAAATAPPAS